MINITTAADGDMASVEQVNELVSTIETLKEAASEKLVELAEEKAEYPDVNTRNIDSLPECFTQHYYGTMAIQALEGIKLPEEGQATTQDEADDIESDLRDARNLLDQAGMSTEQILNPPVRRRMYRPHQVKELEKAAKEAMIKAAGANALQKKSNEDLKQRCESPEVSV